MINEVKLNDTGIEDSMYNTDENIDVRNTQIVQLRILIFARRRNWTKKLKMCLHMLESRAENHRFNKIKILDIQGNLKLAILISSLCSRVMSKMERALSI